MKRWQRLILWSRVTLVATLVLGCLTASTTQAAEIMPAASTVSSDDIQDVLLLLSDGARLVRLHIRHGELGYQSKWGNYLVDLFDQLDRNRGGELDEQELALGPWTQLRAARADRTRFVGSEDFTLLDFDVEDENDRVSFSEFVTLLAPYCSTVSYTAGNLAGGLTLWSGLGEKLDLNGDGQLAKVEAESPYERLRRLDADDNEALTLVELNPEISPITGVSRLVASPGNSASGATTRPAVIGVPPDVSPLEFMERLIVLYDGGGEPAQAGNGTLSRDEWPLSTADFESQDLDQNGQLNTTELLAWYEQLRPNFEIVVQADLIGGKSPSIELLETNADTSEAPQSGDVEFSRTWNGALVVRWQTSEIEFRPAQVQTAAIQKSNNQKLFKNLDGDNNDYLDEAELSNRLPRQVLNQMDADRNKMIFEEEWLDYYAKQSEISNRRVHVRAMDLGSTLFELLDDNRDGRLTIRELRALAGFIDQWDRNGDGTVSVQEMLPRRLRVEVGVANVENVSTNSFVAFYSAEAPAAPSPTEGVPAWFTAMDRNRDGDISQREFLGKRADFMRLDANGDGLIAAQEAGPAKP